MIPKNVPRRVAPRVSSSGMLSRATGIAGTASLEVLVDMDVVASS